MAEESIGEGLNGEAAIPPLSGAGGELARRVELAVLLDFYGALLTEKQREALSLYLEEDLSLSEIARESGVSRQGIHESLSRGSARLMELESLMGFAARSRRIEAGLSEALTALKAGRSSEAERIIADLLRDGERP